MTFNDHSRLRGQHAFLSASKYSWINYDPDKLAVVYTNFMATQKGTELHEFAAKCIELGQKLPRSKKTLNNYVNDAIGFRMTPEQVLYYSDNCFGTADAICFRDDILRIHDLKTGAIPAHSNTELNPRKSRSRTASTNQMIFSSQTLVLTTSIRSWIKFASLIRSLQS